LNIYIISVTLDPAFLRTFVKYLGLAEYLQRIQQALLFSKKLENAQICWYGSRQGPLVIAP
jgi:hypothetical protein